MRNSLIVSSLIFLICLCGLWAQSSHHTGDNGRLGAFPARGDHRVSED